MVIYRAAGIGLYDMNGKSNFLLQRTADNTIDSLRQIRFRKIAEADTKYSRDQ
jgi:hypothetical protein